MRRASALSLMIGLLVIASASPAEAQGFWRWFEKLSGPKIGGLGVEVTFLCPRPADPAAGEPSRFRKPTVELSCKSVDRSLRHWFSAGAQMYILTGDNSVTDDPNDRVDVTGIVPFATWHMVRGLSLSAGPAIRRYSTPAGQFTEVPIEIWLGIRPVRTSHGLRAASTFNGREDFLELRFGLVLHPGFDEGDFGPGTPAIDREVSGFIGVMLDFTAWR